MAFKRIQWNRALYDKLVLISIKWQILKFDFSPVKRWRSVVVVIVENCLFLLLQNHDLYKPQWRTPAVWLSHVLCEIADTARPCCWRLCLSVWSFLLYRSVHCFLQHYLRWIDVIVYYETNFHCPPWTSWFLLVCLLRRFFVWTVLWTD